MAAKTATKQEKLSLVDSSPEFYKAPCEPQLVELGPRQYITITGGGSPESDEFQTAIGAMYGVAYTTKMARKKSGADYKVAPLEGLWSAECDPADLAESGALWTAPRDSWQWKLLIMVPDFITAEEIADSAAQVAERKGDPAACRVKLETLEEGLCVQMTHIGPYATEPESIERMKRFMAENGLERSGPHHEVYMGDPRITKPERLKTILRQPVRREH